MKHHAPQSSSAGPQATLSAAATIDPASVGKPIMDDNRFKDELMKCVPALRAFARSLCGSSDLADDLAQEALTKAWAARNTLRPDTYFKTWMFTILRNHYFSYCRKARRVVAWDPDVAQKILVTGEEQSGNIALAELNRAMQRLPVEQREAIILVGAGGFSYEEAAQVAGCAVGTIKSRVARARIALKQLMETGEARPKTALLTGSQARAQILQELVRLDPRKSSA
jgi:RNA polymerase sigma-70 factor, ECF subfamily